MKKLRRSICYVIIAVLIHILGFSLLQSPSLTKEKSDVLAKQKYLPTRYFTYEKKEEMIDKNQEEPIEEVSTIKETNEVQVEQKKIEVVEKVIETPKKEEIVITPTTDILETLVGKLSGYGPDCYGCTSNKTASGYYVGGGNIYYQDPTFGKVRILAGDSKYPFHTIVRIKNSNAGQDVIGIVLDRGSAIGIGEKYLFDLLYKTEKEASGFGVSQNVTFEILRLGN